MKCSRKSIPTS